MVTFIQSYNLIVETTCKLTLCKLWVGGLCWLHAGAFSWIVHVKISDIEVWRFSWLWVVWGQRPFAFKRCRKPFRNMAWGHKKIHFLPWDSFSASPLFWSSVLSAPCVSQCLSPPPVMSLFWCFLSVTVIFCPAQCLCVGRCSSLTFSFPFFEMEASPWVYSLVQIPLGASWS